MPETVEEIKAIIEICREKGMKYFVFGNGSNILFTDDFHDGAYINLSKLSALSNEENVITAQAGVRLSSLCSYAASLSLSGIEQLSGIPGTVGGAVYMNAGAYGGEIKDALIKSVYLSESGEIKELSDREHDFGYRKSVFMENGGIVLSSSFSLKNGNKDEIKAVTAELLKKRNDKQPLNYPSAGSTFKRPEGYFAGKLIEDCGLKGFSVGDAQVSEKHCGFVINRGNASASDIIKLIEHIRKTVFEKFKVELNTEVKIV